MFEIPDKIADLPVHEDADYHEFHGYDKKNNEIEKVVKKKDEKIAAKDSEEIIR